MDKKADYEIAAQELKRLQALRREADRSGDMQKVREIQEQIDTLIKKPVS